MRASILLLISALLSLHAVLYRLTSHEIAPSEVVPGDLYTLEGTWQLMAARLAHHSEGEETTFSTESSAVALKIFTRNRFVALRYDKASNALLGTGGGTYIQLGDDFTEYIDYHSWDSTLTKFPQTFSCHFEGDLFTQRGVIRGGNTDGRALEEIYQRIEDPMSSLSGDYPLVGSWKLSQWANGDLVKPEPLPDGTLGFKIFTPNYFYAVRYRESGGIASFAFGTYKATREFLTETIISLDDLSAVGRSYTYAWSRQGRDFKMSGFLDSDQYMGYKIEEYYQRE